MADESQLFSESAEDESFRGGESEIELTTPWSQPYKEKKRLVRGESETGPDELLKQYNEGKHVWTVDTIG